MKPANETESWREVAAIFFKLGCLSFGGPVAHIALMEQEIVTRRNWLSRQEFLDLIGATNLIPGPNSTEMAIHLGLRRAGWPGLLAAGLCFICPAVAMVLALAWLYATYGQLPSARALLYGIGPVIIAIIAQALWKFGGTALKNRFTIVIAIFVTLLITIFHFSEIAALLGAALAGLVYGISGARRIPATPAPEENAPKVLAEKFADPDDNATDDATRRSSAFLFFIAPVSGIALSWQLFWIFLKIGAILYGSGYVLLAFLRADLVPHFLSDRQLIDAVAVGQMTPGPVFTTATFIGYQIAGLPGALAATLGIFLPSFVFVALLSLLLQRLQSSPIMRAFLDAVNAASVALMAIVTWQLARDALIDIPAIFLALITLALLLKFSLNSAWLILGGALFGLAAQLARAA